MALVLLPALALTRPWQRLPAWVVVLGTATSLAAVSVCLVSATGWSDSDVAAGYGIASMLALIMLAWVAEADPLLDASARRRILVALLLLAGLEQMVQALLAWWGGEDPSTPLTGTYGWRNPFAAAMLVPAIVGMGVVVLAERPTRLIGWVAGPLGVAAIVLSTSRATMLALAACWALVAGTLLVPRETRRRRASRILAVSALAGCVTFALPGPPLFRHWVSPFGATETRSSSGETVGANAGYREEFWQEAIRVAEHHPLVGAGFRSLSIASPRYVPSSWALSPQAHNGYLQPLSDGGLLLGVPFLGACCAVVVVSARRTRRAVRQPAGGLTVVATGALLAVMGHSFVDFDWSRPALMVVPVALLALMTPPSPSHSARRGRWLIAPLVLAAAAPVLAAHSRQVSDDRVRSAQQLHGGAQIQALTRIARGATTGDRAGRLLLGRALSAPDDGRLGIDPVSARIALSSTRRAAEVDTGLAIERARVERSLGDDQDAIRIYEELLPSAGRRPAEAAALAPLAADLGRPHDLRAIVSRDFFDAARGGSGAIMWIEEVALSHLVTPAQSGCAAELAASVSARPQGMTSLEHPPPATDCGSELADLRP